MRRPSLAPRAVIAIAIATIALGLTAVGLVSQVPLPGQRTHIAGRLTPAPPPGVPIPDHTRGQPITVAGRSVQLPSDAYLLGISTGSSCYVAPCPEIPSYVVKRGASSIHVGINSGQLAGEIVAPGDGRAFDFLREFLQSGFSGSVSVAVPTPQPDSAPPRDHPSPDRQPVGRPVYPTAAPAPPLPQVAQDPAQQRQQAIERYPRESGVPSGPRGIVADETRGSPVTIAGRTVHLLQDAYVEGIVTEILCLTSPERERPCPEVPAYKIVRGKSNIYVGIQSGRINWAEIAPGEEWTFDFLKEALR